MGLSYFFWTENLISLDPNEDESLYISLALDLLQIGPI